MTEANGIGRWNADDDRAIAHGRARGLTCKQIAELCMPSRSAGAIKVRLQRLGMGKRKNKRHPPRSVVSPPQTYRFCVTARQEAAFGALMAGRLYEDRRFKSGRLA